MRKVIFSDKDFDLAHTFDCGQCFRWEEKDGAFYGVAGEYWGIFRKTEEGVELTTNCPEDAFWIKYLDLERDYGKIKKTLSVNKLMEEAVSYGCGIRILRQEFF